MPGLADLAFGGWPSRVAADSRLVGRGLALVPGLPDLALGGRPPVVLEDGGSSGSVGNAGHADQVGGRRQGPSTRAWASLDLDMITSD